MQYINANNKYALADELAKMKKVVVIFNPPSTQLFLVEKSMIDIIDGHWVYHRADRMFDFDLFQNQTFHSEHWSYIRNELNITASFCPVLASTLSRGLKEGKLKMHTDSISFVTDMETLREVFWIDTTEKIIKKWYADPEKLKQKRQLPFTPEQLTPRHEYYWSKNGPSHRIAYLSYDGPFHYDFEFNAEVSKKTLPLETKEISIAELYRGFQSDAVIKEVWQTTEETFLVGDKAYTYKETNRLTPNIIMDRQEIFTDYIIPSRTVADLVLDGENNEFMRVSFIWGKGIMVEEPINPKCRIDGAGDSGEDMFFYGGTYTCNAESYQPARAITSQEFTNNLIALNVIFSDVIRRARIYEKYSSEDEYFYAMKVAFEDYAQEFNQAAEQILNP